jgi:hypothetical protein
MKTNCGDTADVRGFDASCADSSTRAALKGDE